MTWTRALVIVVLAVGVLDARPAAACSCAPAGPACVQYWRVSAVFAGQVLGIQPSPERPYLVVVRFAVERRGRGIEGDVVEMEVPPQNGGNCGYTFRTGERYVVYAHTDPDGRLTTTMCSGTKLAVDAAEDLAFLDELGAWPQVARLFGHVLRDERDLLLSYRGTGYGVPGARVRVSGTSSTGGNVSRVTVTDMQGRWQFRNLPLGTYTATLMLPPGLVLATPPLPVVPPAQPPRTIALTNPFQCAELWSRPSTDAQITGMVVTSDGRPARDEPINLIAAAHVQHRDDRIPHFTVQTGADGRFTFAHLAPGTYFVGVNLERRPQANELDRRAYHPGTSDPVRATVVTVAPGSRVELAPLTLPEWPRDRQITGRVVWADGTPAPEATVMLYGRGTAHRVALDADGRFSLAVPYGEPCSLIAYEDPTHPVLHARSAQHYVGRYDRGARMTLTLRRP